MLQDKFSYGVILLLLKIHHHTLLGLEADSTCTKCKIRVSLEEGIRTSLRRREEIEEKEGRNWRKSEEVGSVHSVTEKDDDFKLEVTLLWNKFDEVSNWILNPFLSKNFHPLPSHQKTYFFQLSSFQNCGKRKKIDKRVRKKGRKEERRINCVKKLLPLKKVEESCPSKASSFYSRPSS